MSNIIRQTKDTPVPMGEHIATITDAMIDTGQYGDQVKFTFDLQGEHLGRNLWGWCGVRFSPRSKLYKWAGASIWAGKQIPTNYDLDLDHFIGRQCIVRVLVKDREDGTQTNKVDSIAPLIPNDDPAEVIPVAAVPPAQPAHSMPDAHHQTSKVAPPIAF